MGTVAFYRMPHRFILDSLYPPTNTVTLCIICRFSFSNRNYSSTVSSVCNSFISLLLHHQFAIVENLIFHHQQLTTVSYNKGGFDYIMFRLFFLHYFLYFWVCHVIMFCSSLSSYIAGSSCCVFVNFMYSHHQKMYILMVFFGN